MALVAAGASLAGLALGLALHTNTAFSNGLTDSLRQSETACDATASSLLLGAPLSAWMVGLFSGLCWVSVSLWQNREGYQGAGKGLAFWGGATAALLGSRLSSAEEGTVLQISIGAALLVAVAGFLSRASESPSRATGAIAACATAALLTSGTITQAKALLSPWCILDTVPELSQTDTKLGSVNASHHIVAFADLSNPVARKELTALIDLYKTDSDYKVTLVPLATEKGKDLAIGLRCATESGQGEAFTFSILRTPTKSPMDLAVASRLSAASFKTCTERETLSTQLKTRLSDAEKLGIAAPLGILLDSDEQWIQLSPKQPYLSQISTLTTALSEDS